MKESFISSLWPSHSDPSIRSLSFEHVNWTSWRINVTVVWDHVGPTSGAWNFLWAGPRFVDLRASGNFDLCSGLPIALLVHSYCQSDFEILHILGNRINLFGWRIRKIFIHPIRIRWLDFYLLFSEFSWSKHQKAHNSYELFRTTKYPFNLAPKD